MNISPPGVSPRLDRERLVQKASMTHLLFNIHFILFCSKKIDIENTFKKKVGNSIEGAVPTFSEDGGLALLQRRVWDCEDQLETR